MPDTEDRTARPLALPMLGESAWAIRRDLIPRLAETSHAAANVAWVDAAERAAVAASTRAAARRGRAAERAGAAVAVLPLTGILTPRGSLLSLLFGGGWGGLLDFRDEFDAAVASPDIGAIVIDVDSPGGLTDLIPETAAQVRNARGTKPIVAVANTQACSAAYWIACQADEVVVTPSGYLGAIGVYIVHEDWSKFNETMGIDPTYVSAGRYKVEGNPDEPLSDDAKTAIQEIVDDVYTLFVDDVAAGRGVTADQVRNGYGEGRSLRATRAVAAGLADRIATLDDVVHELIAGGGNGDGSNALADDPTPPVKAADEPEPPEIDPAPAPAAIDAAERARVASVLLG